MAERPADFTLTMVATPKIEAAIARAQRALDEYRAARAELDRLLAEPLYRPLEVTKTVSDLG